MRMDKRNSKETHVAEVNRLADLVENVFQAGENGIAYVGAANYQSRENEARRNLYKAYYGDNDAE